MVSGKNIYPEEIEQVLLAYPAIEQAAVIGIDDAKRGQRLVAVVKVIPGQKVYRTTLLAHCRCTLPHYKVPGVYGVCELWPQT